MAYYIKANTPANNAHDIYYNEVGSLPKEDGTNSNCGWCIDIADKKSYSTEPTTSFMNDAVAKLPANWNAYTNVSAVEIT